MAVLLSVNHGSAVPCAPIAQAVVEVVHQRPSVLRIQWIALRQTLRALSDALGTEHAPIAGSSDPIILHTPSDAIFEAWHGLQDVLGPDLAWQMAQRSPKVLCAGGVGTGASLRAIEGALGRDNAVEAVCTNPQLLAANAELLDETLGAAVAVVGQTLASIIAGCGLEFVQRVSHRFPLFRPSFLPMFL